MCQPIVALMKWFGFSALSAILMALAALASKYVLNRGVKESLLLFWGFIFGALLMAVYMIYKKEPVKIEIAPLAIVILVITVSLLGNYFYFRAINLAPNPGYAAAVSSLNVVVVTVLSLFLFKSELTPIKGLGVALAAVSVFLLSR